MLLLRCVFFCLYLLFYHFVLKKQKDDECAKEIKLSYPGYNSNYSTVNNTPIVYELLLEQGVTYNLIIYLKLTDGAENIFWRQQYKAPGKS